MMPMTIKMEKTKKMITTEISLPRIIDRRKIRSIINHIKAADKVNITCNPLGRLHISSLAGAAILKENKITPIMQLCTRDANRLQLQSQILGAYALGIKDIIVMSGDKIGEKTAKEVHDTTVPELIRILKSMNDGIDGYGKKMKPTNFTIGAVLDYHRKDVLSYTKKKILAGATIFQTQIIDKDNARAKKIIQTLKSRYPHIRILGTIIHIGSEKTLRYIEKNIWGIRLSDKQRNMLKENKPKKTLEYTIDTIKETEQYTDGIHLLTMGHYKDFEKIIKKIKQHHI
jgi:methylenetetrahydrofolate reductase (NADPH)